MIYKLIIEDEDSFNDMELEFLDIEQAIHYCNSCIRQGYKSVKVSQESKEI